ncbi:DUF4302 domain-containing protein [Chitinophaga qingshengii]|uniref:DUF4302 domain-containing protein n=1 Tax=Chitinophaga qingshengii TaxID=1569794 RepID=A0ABR7TYW1_9BACT|nr:DUF4302 domain-containing protein [Chitinophaga qingshengii]MBC9934751.1 DUF4302 domain-containing protein [Chitinophaga qingshengii]
MKKIALYTLLCAAMVASCRKDNSLGNPIEPSYPDPSRQLDSFKTALGNAPNGWVGTLVPGNSNQVYSIYLQLDNGKNEATLYTDLSIASATTPSKSPFRLSVSQTVNPTITLAEGSQLQDIRLAVKRGVDTAYAFRYASGDTLILLGNKYSDELRLVKASAQTKTDYANGKLKTVISEATNFLDNAGYLSFRQNNIPCMVYFDTDNKSVGFASVNNNVKSSAGSGYAFTPTGIVLRHPVQVGNQTISTLNWDADAGNFYTQPDKDKSYFDQGNVPALPAYYLVGTEISGQQYLLPPNVLPLPGWSADFKAIWTNMTNKFKARGLPLVQAVLDFQVPGYLTVNITFASYVGRFTFKYTRTAEGVYTFVQQPFTPDTPGANGNAVKNEAKPLTDMLSTNQFAMKFMETPDGLLLSFVSVNNPSVTFTSVW